MHNIRVLREKIGFSQQQVAESVECKPAGCSKMGKRFGKAKSGFTARISGVIPLYILMNSLRSLTTKHPGRAWGRERG